jgi:hypothetical protein
LAPDYFGFRIASNGVWVRYGLAVRNGTTDKFSRAYFKNEPCGPETVAKDGKRKHDSGGLRRLPELERET